VAAVARRSHGQEDRRPRAPDLVIELGPVHSDSGHRRSPPVGLFKRILSSRRVGTSAPIPLTDSPPGCRSPCDARLRRRAARSCPPGCGRLRHCAADTRKGRFPQLSDRRCAGGRQSCETRSSAAGVSRVGMESLATHGIGGGQLAESNDVDVLADLQWQINSSWGVDDEWFVDAWVARAAPTWRSTRARRVSARAACRRRAPRNAAVRR
jgi:hypothetical protein